MICFLDVWNFGAEVSVRSAYPSSKNDKLEAEVKKQEKDFLHNEQVEYSGTVLSTDWKEVGVKKIENTPPDGMELKKWEI
ncbi:hypothetical protein HID58_012555 [Brassica napus]|uniref:SGS domain-containing protein n=1 Tax=Brassica napus TaxID=3708 RepID=A0ABQ8E3G0_BRANA|nr:hypothetical protein HID58_012555 [Brassica napus]